MKSLKLVLLFCVLLFCKSHLLAQEFTTQELNNFKSQVKNLLEKGKNSKETDQYYQARKDFDDALKIAKDIKENKITGAVYYQIGLLLLEMEEYEEAELSFRKAIEKQELVDDKNSLAKSYDGLADNFLAQFRFDSSKKYYEIAKDLFKEAGNIDEELYTTLKKGIAHYKQDEFTYALEAFDNCIKNANQKKDLDILSAAYLYKGHIESRLINLDSGARTSYKGYMIAEDNNIIEVLKNSFIVISDIEALKGENEKAIYYLKKHIRYNDSLDAVKNTKLSTKKRLEFLSNNETEYQIEKIENFEELKNTKAINKVTTLLSIALITILSLFTISLYKNNTIRKKSNSELSKKNKELVIAKDKAEQATKAKANFLSTVTHELRTPLYAVTGLTNILLDEEPKKEQIHHLKSLKFSGDYLLTFINDILEVNKIEAQKVDVENQPFNLKQNIQNIISALNNAQTNNSVKISLDYDKDLPETFISDQVKLSQILINLIGNSIKFTKDGTIWVRVKKQSHKKLKYRLLFEVEDNGIGISQEKQDNIFESFSQGSVEINRKYGGTGLGLSIVKGLIDVLGGTINIESEIDKGTLFYFEIPMLKADKVEEQTAENYFRNISKKELDKINVLIVEDNKINQMITQKILSKMNISSSIVDNGEDAVIAAKQYKYNVILMDIHMPGISGIEATKQIRAFNKDLIIFALTAVTLDDKIKEFKETGFTNIISKPFKQDVFEKILYTELTKAKIID